MTVEILPESCVRSTDNLRALTEQASVMGHTLREAALQPVDARSRIRGIDGSRVADDSIMRLVTGSTTDLPTIMIGKGSDLLRDRTAAL